MKRVVFFVSALMLSSASVSYAATVTVNITAGTNAVSHTIEKQTGGGAFTTLTTLTMPTVQYVDSAVSVGQSYCYRAITNSLVDSAAASAPCCAALLPAGAAAISCTVNP